MPEILPTKNPSQHIMPEILPTKHPSQHIMPKIGKKSQSSFFGQNWPEPERKGARSFSQRFSPGGRCPPVLTPNSRRGEKRLTPFLRQKNPPHHRMKPPHHLKKPQRSSEKGSTSSVIASTIIWKRLNIVWKRLNDYLKKAQRLSEKGTTLSKKASTSSETVCVCSCTGTPGSNTAWKKTGIFVKLNGAGTPSGQNFQILNKCSEKDGQETGDRDDR